ncbi:hypothetical protein AgCh_022741 [Apium graveolens]
MWRYIWRIRAPPKVLNLVWRAISNCLPTKSNLHAKFVPVTTTCPICSGEEETVLHALVVCPFANSCWYRRGRTYQGVDTDSFGIWLGSLFDKLKKEEHAEIVSLCWAIWNARNQVVWDNKKSSVDGVLTSMRQYLAEYSKAQDFSTQALYQFVEHGDGAQVWVRPKIGAVKVTVDAEIFAESFSYGIGMLARNDMGEVIWGRSESYPGNVCADFAEAMVVKEALSWCKLNKWQEIVLESDCLSVVQALRCSITMRSPLGYIIRECREMLKELNIEVFYIKRSANEAAHVLARESSSFSGRVFDGRSVPVSLESQHSLLNDNNLPHDDGYNWRKYGQKQLLNNEHPRSYYRCNHKNCAAKMQVQSVDDQVTEIVYRGHHNHRRPQFSEDGNDTERSSDFLDTQWNTGLVVEDKSRKLNDECLPSSLSTEDQGSSNKDKLAKIRIRARNEDEPNARSQHSLFKVSGLIYDDGYKWRKYGEKQILGSEHPRTYYKCAYTNCAAKKHMQSVDGQVTGVVYRGQHNHHLPQSSKDGNVTEWSSDVLDTQGNTGLVVEDKSRKLNDESLASSLLSAEDQGSGNKDKLANTRKRETNEDEPDAKRRMEAQIDFPASEYTLFDINELLVLMENVLECKLPKSKSVVVRCLKVMHIRNSNLSDIPDNLSFPDLENLFLQSKIDSISIPSSIFERMPALRVLDMSNTSIRTLPASFSKLIKLEKLLLHGCQSLKELPQEICAIVTLNFLDLSSCTNLAEIPESIALLESLSSLNLTDCISLTKLPESITKLRSLKYFYISGCSSLLEFHTPEGSLHTISPSSQTDEMEVLLDFHKSEGTLHDITELLALLEKVAQYEFMKSKSLAVRSLKVIHIRNSKLPDIPDNLSFPDLEELFLQSNLHKSHIPSSFFKQMPALKVLDMSNTSIQTLPPPVSELFELEQLILRHCELLMELPPEIGALRNLRVLDLEGTNLVCLPDELKELTNLNCLKVSLYDAENYRKSKRIVAIIPAAIVSKLTQLEELSIDVDPQDVWCSAAMKVILEDLPSLRMLKTLKLYLPTTELLQNLLKLTWNDGDLPIYQNVLNFNVIVGPRSQHFISRIPCDLEEEFLRLKKCLKYINGKEDTTQIAEALEHANALYLDRHWTIQNLSLFNLEVSKKLKFCLLVDCNEMQMIFDDGNFNHGAANKGANLLSMQYLAIHYLKNLEVIWNGPGVGICLQTLKVLTLHMCPNLKTVFTPLLLGNLQNLKEIIVEDCPKITSLIAEDSTHLASQEALPGLKKLSLLYLPELVSISSGICIGPELENIVIYDCPNLKRLPLLGMRNKEVVKIKGEGEWWKALEWKESEWSNGQPQYLHHAFSELDIDGDFLDELATQYVNSLRLFVEECNAN